MVKSSAYNVQDYVCINNYYKITKSHVDNYYDDIDKSITNIIDFYPFFCILVVVTCKWKLTSITLIFKVTLAVVVLEWYLCSVQPRNLAHKSCVDKEKWVTYNNYTCCHSYPCNWKTGKACIRDGAVLAYNQGKCAQCWITQYTELQRVYRALQVIWQLHEYSGTSEQRTLWGQYKFSCLERLSSLWSFSIYGNYREWQFLGPVSFIERSNHR